ncbi:FGGY-family carbohydrate kinase [Endozoicomonas sp. YOMI1]|uniref:FGGY-family carbohydrate kinase n=1 Tax=Endozoicomonas sp. YOMI1 TaxID=2828739 RepID=UPI002147FE94|nr:FGGY-family carbohydrate kinase [Endozoicomonas sp. YOMI1]
MRPVLLSIDVGTHSLRSAFVSLEGRVLAHNEEPLLIWKTASTMEFCSENIWEALVTSVNRLVSEHPLNQEDIKGIGIDTTYSLVLLDQQMQPVHLPGSNRADTFGWMDSRASQQAAVITREYPGLFGYAGSGINARSNCSKLLWLFQCAPETWQAATCILDLYDYVTWKLTACLTRTPDSTSHIFTKDAAAQLNMDIEERFKGKSLEIAAAIGDGLCKSAADQLNLKQGIPVSTGIVDAYGGTLATILADNHQGSQQPLDCITRRVSFIGGISSNYVAFSRDMLTCDGTDGPYPSVLEGYWLIYARQTAAGAFIDHIITSHPAYSSIHDISVSLGIGVHEYLNQILYELAGNNRSEYAEGVSKLTAHLHMLPYFDAPEVDQPQRGMITGLTLDKSHQSLAVLYLASIQALALDARYQLEKLKKAGYHVELLIPTGGLAKNQLLLTEHINILNIPAAIPEEKENMLLSGAITGSVAADIYDSIEDAIRAMSRYQERIEPNRQLVDFYQAKYDTFIKMLKDQQSWE